MKLKIKNLASGVQFKMWIPAFAFLFFGLFANAQNSNFSTLATIGLTTPILDNGVGLHLGVNPSYPVSSNFSIEGQISYLYTKVGSSFLSGNEGQSSSVNALVGGRLYLNSEEKTNRFYLNLLVGGNYNREKVNDLKKDGAFDLGFSSGAFLELNKFLIGVSYDTPQNLILKVGYVF